MQPQLPPDFIADYVKMKERLELVEKSLTNDSVPIGAEINWPASTTLLPFNYLPCDGRAIDRTGYATLFAELGTTYGIGDGSTSFNIPNRTGARLKIPLATAWTTFASAGIFTGGVSDYGGGFQTCAYMRDDYGWVTLRGLWKFAVGNYASLNPGTLPVGYRPAAPEIFLGSGSYVGGNNLAFRVDIDAGGLLTVSNTSSANIDGQYGSLAGIHYDTGLAQSATTNETDNWVIKVY